MSGSHGELFHEIGKLVLAAHAGQSIDLAAKSEELALRYGNLGMPPELIAKAIARALGAIGISMAIVSERHAANGHASTHANGVNGHAHAEGTNGAAGAEAEDQDGAEDAIPKAPPAEARAKAASALFPSGLRISLLS